MTTLVTGGNGWVPSHIVRRLARRGERVVSYDLMAPDDLLREHLGDTIERVIFEQGDVTDEARLRAVATRHGVTKLIHAAVITPRRDRERRERKRIVEVNLLGTVNTLEVARSKTVRVLRPRSRARDSRCSGCTSWWCRSSASA